MPRNARCEWYLGLGIIVTAAWLAAVGLHAAETGDVVPTVTNTAPPLAVTGVAMPAATPTGAPAPSPAPPPSAPVKRSAADLEKLVMPIALHSDPLIAILLPASVYPVEIVQAARFVKDTNNIAKVDQQPWDDNVKAVAKLPALIAQLDADLDWTVRLGQAFLDEPKELMDTIQALRAKAQQAGTLQTTAQQVVVVTNVVVEKTVEQQTVVVTNTVVQIQPSNPQVVYVPTYPSTVYYPPPSYVYDPWAPLVTFGAGVALGAIIANNCDWHGGGIYVGGGGMVVWGGGGYHGDVDIDIDNNVNIDRGERPTPQSGNRTGATGAKPTQQKWQPDQNRMRTGGASPSTLEARGWTSSGVRPATQPAAGTRPATPPTGMSGTRPTTGAVGTRPSTGAASPARPSASPSINRPSASPAAPRPSSGASATRPSGGSGGSAFSGMSSGAGSRSFSSRGATSRSGGFGGGGRAGGGGRGGGGRR